MPEDGGPTVILITGPPGSGKTTLIKKLVEEIPPGVRAVGFYTEEIRERGERVGFRLVGLDGSGGILSHINVHSPYRVGRYRVDIGGFDDFLRAMDFDGADAAVVDEIGKMECFSERFIALMDDMFSSGKPLLATIALKGNDYMESLKNRPGVKLFTLRTRADWEKIIKEVRALLGWA